MNITINIKAIANAARRDYRNDNPVWGPTELNEASAAEISDYVMYAVREELEAVFNATEEVVRFAVETLVTTGPSS